MERLAGRIILLWGWRRALVALLPARLPCWRRRPTTFSRPASSPSRCSSGCSTARRAEPPAFLRRLRPAFATGWWFGFGYFLAGLWWIGSALLVEADSFAWALPFAVSASRPAGVLLRLSPRRWPASSGPTASAASPHLPSASALAEWLRSFLFTGFPWNPIGYAAMPMPLLMQACRWSA